MLQIDFVFSVFYIRSAQAWLCFDSATGVANGSCEMIEPATTGWCLNVASQMASEAMPLVHSLVPVVYPETAPRVPARVKATLRCPPATQRAGVEANNPLEYECAC